MKKIFLAVAMLVVGLTVVGPVSAAGGDSALKRSEMWCQENWEIAGYKDYDACLYERKAEGRSWLEKASTVPGDISRGLTDLTLRQAYYNRPLEEENLTYQEWQAFHGYGYSGMGPVPQGSFTLPEAETFGAEISANVDLRSYILNVLNFVLSFLGIIAIGVVIFAGWMYVTSGGDDGQQEKAKKMILYASIGIIVILVSFALVNTLIRGLVENGENFDPTTSMTDKRVRVEITPEVDGAPLQPISRGYKFELGESITFSFADPVGEIVCGGDGNVDTVKWEFGGQDTVFEETAVRKFFDPGWVHVRVSGRAMVGENDDGKEMWDAFSGTTDLYNGPTVESNFTFTPDRPDVGETVIFDASESTALFGAIDSYAWTCTPSSGGSCPSDFPNNQKKFATTFDAVGSYTIELTVTDTNGGEAVEQDVVVVGALVQNVTAKMVVTPVHPKVDETVVFDASGSNVTGGEIENYSWECAASLGGECPTDFGSGGSENFATVFENAGAYHITLTVTGTDDVEGTDEKTVVVTGISGPGVLTAVMGFEGAPGGTHVVFDRGTPVTVSSDGSVDEEGGDNFQASWLLNGKMSSVEEIAGTLLSKLGTSNVMLKIKSGLTGNVKSASGEAVVKNCDPVINLLTATLLENPLSHVRVVTSATDPDTSNPLTQYRFEAFHWGEALGVQPNPTPEAVFDLSQFEGEQEFVFRVKVFDVDGGTATEEITRSFDLPTLASLNSPPTASILVQPGTTGDVNTTFYFSAVATDPDGDALDYHWQFSDGVIRTGQMISRAFQFPGTYSVHLTVSDGLAEAFADASVTVTE